TFPSPRLTLEGRGHWGAAGVGDRAVDVRYGLGVRRAVVIRVERERQRVEQRCGLVGVVGGCLEHQSEQLRGWELAGELLVLEESIVRGRVFPLLATSCA